MTNSCSLFSFDLGACVNGAVLGWLAAVPWWAWVVVALIVVGIVYRLAGWLGLVGLAGAFGYGAKTLEDAQKARNDTENGDGEPDRFPPPIPPRRQRTIFDILRGN